MKIIRSLSDVLSVVFVPDCVPLFVVVVQDLDDLWPVSPEFGLNHAQLLLQIPIDVFVPGCGHFKSEVDFAGEVYIEKFGEFFDHCKAKLVNLERLQLFRSLEDRIELMKFVAILELLQLYPNLSVSLPFRS